jgi:hypothetical protein
MLTQFSLDSILQDTSASKSDGIIQEDMCLFNLQDYFPEREGFSHLKMLTDKEYSFHMLMQF